MTSGKLYGKVKWFDNRKGFGFIIPLGNLGNAEVTDASEVFVHHSGLKSAGAEASQEKGGVFRTLYPGEYVEFSLYFDEKANRNYAVDVTGIDGGTLMCENQGTRLTVRRSAKPYEGSSRVPLNNDGFKTVGAGRGKRPNLSQKYQNNKSESA